MVKIHTRTHTYVLTHTFTEPDSEAKVQTFVSCIKNKMGHSVLKVLLVYNTFVELLGFYDMFVVNISVILH